MIHDLFDPDEPIFYLPPHTRHPTIPADQAGVSIPQWPETDYNYPAWWEKGCTGEGCVYVVVDTGVDSNHQELQGQILAVVDGTTPGGDGQDRNSHGTHTFSTILSRRDGRGNAGRAWGGKGVAAKGLNDQGSGSMRSLLNATRMGIEKAVELAAQDIVCSNSWGGPSRMPQYEALQKEMEGKHKVIFVGAAGNDGAGPPSFPGRGMLSVGAIDQQRRLAPFSQYGRICDAGVKVFAAIPGNNYARMDGTSMACPEAAAAIGMLLAWERKQLGARRTWTLTELDAWLQGRTVDLGPGGPDPAYGLGVINPDKFFDVSGTPPPPPPPPPPDMLWRLKGTDMLIEQSSLRPVGRDHFRLTETNLVMRGSALLPLDTPAGEW